MRTVIACSKPLLAVNFKLKVMLRAASTDHAQEPLLVRLEQLEQTVFQDPPDLVVIVLSPDPEGGLAVLRRLRGAMPGRILVVGPSDDSKFILRALHEGADHFLDEDDLEAQLEAVLPRIRNRDDSNPRAGRLVALLGAGGGSGLSTLAVNVAAVLARDYERCALIDLKPGVGDLASLLDLKPAHTLADLCRNADRLDDDMFESALAAHSSGIHLLAFTQSFNDIRYVTPQGVSQALAVARERFPYVVADLENCFHEEQVRALRAADVILLVIRLDFTSLRNANRILEHLDKMDVPRGRVRLVVNRYGQPKEMSLEEAQVALGLRATQCIPDDPKTINGANNTGVPAVLKSPSTRVAQELVKLAHSVRTPEHVRAAEGDPVKARGSRWLGQLF